MRILQMKVRADIRNPFRCSIKSEKGGLPDGRPLCYTAKVANQTRMWILETVPMIPVSPEG